MTPWIEIAGWTLVHSVWQGFVIAAFTAVALRLLRSESANARYVVACAGLAALCALSVVTAMRITLAQTPQLTPLAITAAALPQQAGAQAAPLAGMPGNQPTSAVQDVRSAIDANLTVVVIGWLLGVVVLLTRALGGWWQVTRTSRRALTMPCSAWQPAAERIAARLGVDRFIHVVDWSEAVTPAVIGWLRPIVLLPVSAVAALTPAQVEAILAHEIAHIRRHDYAVNVVQTVAETLLFYHPAVWWISGRIRSEREHCCDDEVVTLCGDATGYAQALVQVASLEVGRRSPAMAATAGPLLSRVRRILRKRTVKPRTQRSVASLVVGGVVVCLVCAGALQQISGEVQSQSPGMPPAGQFDLSRAPGSPPPPPVSRFQTLTVDTLEWRMTESDHFSITYVAEIEGQIPGVVAAAERAYGNVAATLRHDLAFRPLLVVVATRDDLNASGWATTDHDRGLRIGISIDVPSARLLDDLKHEITHAFSNDIVPLFVRRANPNRAPDWIDEGLAEYLRGEWDEGDRTQVGELIRTSQVPSIAQLGASTYPGNPRLFYSLAHAAFDFIEARWDKNTVLQFLLVVRKHVIGAPGDVYLTTFALDSDTFDREFEAYLRTRF